MSHTLGKTIVREVRLVEERAFIRLKSWGEVRTAMIHIDPSAARLIDRASTALTHEGHTVFVSRDRDNKLPGALQGSLVTIAKGSEGTFLLGIGRSDDVQNDTAEIGLATYLEATRMLTEASLKIVTEPQNRHFMYDFRALQTMVIAALAPDSYRQGGYRDFSTCQGLMVSTSSNTHDVIQGIAWEYKEGVLSGLTQKGDPTITLSIRNTNPISFAQGRWDDSPIFRESFFQSTAKELSALQILNRVADGLK